ncbi:fructose bisphosphate aldolase [Corynebacterium pacaense]|uniref:fructose bisphosphate aldolase n=1 Tax=Corynebacterium pacaense TaxID=1816684 RepID=UPI0009BB8654|nr:fructose bisphosphate aldolase [Corynebacterium pacaense]
MPNPEQQERFEHGRGFIAALDQSGGSTPKALGLYGVGPSAYSTDEEMFDLINAARTRVVTSPVFTSERILAAILFEGTLSRRIGNRDFVDYLWNEKGIVPILKIDKGLADQADGVQLMRDIPNLEDLLSRARSQGVFGTKERSVIHEANPEGIRRVVAQQFDLGRRVLAADLVPILEPEVTITAPDKAESEKILKEEILRGLEGLGDLDDSAEHRVAIKISIPSVDGFYSDLIEHPRVARVVALSGGYSRAEANERLSRNPGLIASFSRALLDGLSRQQSDEEFNSTLDATIESIYRASIT